MKKKVLFVAHHLTIGGSQKSLVEALNVIDYTKNDVTLYLRKARLDLLPEINNNVDVIINDDKSHYYRKPNVILAGIISKQKQATLIRKKMMDYELSRFFSGKSFDIAISYMQGYTSDILPFIDAKKRVVFFHSSTDEAHDFHNELFGNIDGIIGVNDQVADFLKATYPAHTAKVSHIDNYINANEIVRLANEKNIQKSGIVLCSVGRFSPVKGFDIAVEAAKTLADRGCDFRWFFIGDGPEMGVIKAFSKDLNLENYIILAGMQSNPYPYINACDIYVQPSREEAQPLTLLEAQVLCKPIVTTKTVGGMNIVKDGITGIQTEIDPISLADGIEKLINDNELRETMVEELKKVDYSAEKDRYHRQWAELLEG